jgi:hypothetical protein
MNWIHLAQEGEPWSAHVNTVMKHKTLESSLVGE